MTTPPPAPLVAGLVFVLGLVIGSFLNVCIYRLPRRLSVVTPPSHCPSCGRQIAWYENIPVVSYAVLGARCRSCRTPISVRYPIIELLTAVLFVTAYLVWGLTPLFICRAAFLAAMIVLFMIDLEHKILPNVVTVPGIVIGFAWSLFGPPGWTSSLIGILVGGGSLLAIAEVYRLIRREEGMGMGDVKMLAMVGAFLGWKLMLVTLVLSSFLGSIVGLAVIAVKKTTLKYALPFGTFLAVGACIAALVGNDIVEWYASFYQ